MRNIWVASDHAGFALKQKIVTFLQSLETDFMIHDLGPMNEDRVDYPDYADLVAKKIQDSPKDIGILICGSGQGMCMRANRYSQVRAALVYNEEIARLSRQHNDANILCLGGRVLQHDLALSLVKIFLETEFEGGRHLNRVQKLGRE